VKAWTAPPRRVNFILPLGARVDRKRLVLAKLAVTIASLGLAAFAPNLPLLLLARFGIGLSSTVARQLVPFASSLREAMFTQALLWAAFNILWSALAGLLTAFCHLRPSWSFARAASESDGLRRAFRSGRLPVCRSR
jgi:MFS family permease